MLKYCDYYHELSVSPGRPQSGDRLRAPYARDGEGTALDAMCGELRVRGLTLTCGDRGFESRPLQRRVLCDLGLARRRRLCHRRRDREQPAAVRVPSSRAAPTALIWRPSGELGGIGLGNLALSACLWTVSGLSTAALSPRGTEGSNPSPSSKESANFRS
jgi:hypothetical protein